MSVEIFTEEKKKKLECEYHTKVFSRYADKN